MLDLRTAILRSYYTALNQVLNSGYSVLVGRNIRYIRERLRKPIRVVSMAEEMGYHPDFLSRIFRRETGQTIKDYAIGMRIDMAAELLESGRHSVAEVADYLGFSSISRFITVFRKRKGKPPSRWGRG